MSPHGVFAGLALLIASALTSSVDALSLAGASRVNWHRLQQAKSDGSLEKRAATFPQYNFTQPLDHFTDTGFTFEQRYWVSTRYYKPGGPVFVLDSGEADATERLPYMDTGILDILTNATGGLGVVLEHRYYGTNIISLTVQCACPTRSRVADSRQNYPQVNLSPSRTLPLILSGTHASVSVSASLLISMYS